MIKSPQLLFSGGSSALLLSPVQVWRCWDIWPAAGREGPWWAWEGLGHPGETFLKGFRCQEGEQQLAGQGGCREGKEPAVQNIGSKLVLRDGGCVTSDPSPT